MSDCDEYRRIKELKEKVCDKKRDIQRIEREIRDLECEIEDIKRRKDCLKDCGYCYRETIYWPCTPCPQPRRYWYYDCTPNWGGTSTSGTITWDNCSGHTTYSTSAGNYSTTASSSTTAGSYTTY